jgi:Fe-S oxidoreductase
MKSLSQNQPLRILLILPADGTYHYRGFFKRSLSYAPLTLTTLAALVPPELEAEIDILDEGVSPPRPPSRFYDLVGLSAVTSAAPRAYELAAFWKDREAYVVMGGAHASLLPEEALARVDTVLTGLGEEIWPRFLRDWVAGRPERMYSHQPRSGPLVSPRPRRDLLPASTYLPMTTVLANRGCVNHCQFCSIARLWGHPGLARPVEDMAEEIKAQGRRRFIFLDPNLYADRDYALNLFQAIRPLNIRWSGLGTLNLADDPEFLDLMVKSGCTGLLVGLESLDSQVIRDIGKRHNEVARYPEQIKRLHDRGIAVLGCFVLGFDGDTKESLRKNVQAVMDLKLDAARFSVLTPFPGTGLFQRLDRDGRILTRDWSRYDTEQVVFQPARMSPEDLGQVLRETWLKTYSLKAVFARSLIRPRDRLWRLLVNQGFRYYARRLARRQ